ncbi:MAG: amino acid adenylation domain-containing protein [Kiloniellales bacterium]|nr:amino acid adenylation domain-containing protein [Kiloniellales bacterium]
MGDRPESFAGIEDAYPLTSAQAGMLFHSLAEPGSGVYIGQLKALLPDDLDIDAFKAAWDATIRRHGALRAQFVWEGLDDPVLVIKEHAEATWTELDCRHLESEAEQQEALDRYMAAARREGLDLAEAPVMKLALLQRADGRRRFVWTCHHALVDDWSAAIVIKEVARRYARGGVAKNGAADPVLPFRAFAEWLAQRDRPESESYWRAVVEGLPSPTRLQTAPVEIGAGEPDSFGAVEIRLSAEATERLRTLASSLRVTLSALVTAAWAVVLHRASGLDDVAFGVAYTQRPPELTGIEEAVGNFVTTLPARLRLGDHATLRDAVQARHRDSLSAREHDATPLTSIQRYSGFPASQPLFDTIVALEQVPAENAAERPGGQLFTDVAISDQSNYPLALLVEPGEALGLKLLHDPATYGAAAADLLLSMTEAALSALPDWLDAPPFDLPVMTEAEAARAAAGDAAIEALPELGPVHEAILAQARSGPETPAVICGDTVLTYGDLERQSAAWARRLLARGLGTGKRVAIFLDPGPEVFVAMLGALRAGCAYVPMDARYPSERLGHMLEDSRAAVVLTARAHLNDLPEGAPPALLLDAPPPAPEEDAPLPGVTPDRIAYVIYTSGSQGVPKGVMVSHANLTASTAARLAFYDEPPKAYLLLSSISFDSSVAGIYWTLCTGGALVLPHDNAETDMAALGGIIARRGVTHTLCLPSLYETILTYVPREQLASFRVVIAAGEELPRNVAACHADRLPGTRLYNEYGPTEATVWCTACRVDAAEPAGRIPIGRPVPGARIVLRDARQRPVPNGLPAELLVGGAGVAAGYVGLAAETGARFLPDPQDPDRRLYRTGDLVRRRPDGQLDYIGRADNQIKIRGYRVEPGEVEARLADRPEVKQVAVVPFGVGAQMTLAAYIVADPESFPSQQDLQAHARRMLPDWMVPSRFILIETLPRTANGKLDVAALPKPTQPEGDHKAAARPRTPLERDLVRIWQAVLWLDREPGVTEDFFALGGHSLLSIRLVNEIEEQLGLKLPISALARVTTIADQSAMLEATASLETTTASAAPVQDEDDPFAGLFEEEVRSILAYTAGWPGEPALPNGAIRALSRQGSLPPLFWCCNSGHEVAQMARYLGPDQPIYGLRTGKGVVDLSPENHQRENRRLAMHYLRDLLRIQPEGPYYLGGNCQGAGVAMELALALQGLGKPVALVVLIDAVPVHVFHGRVALFFGREHGENPFLHFARPELSWQRRYHRHSLDLIHGPHGNYFDEPQVQPLCALLAARLAEAREETPLPLPDASCRIEWLAADRLPTLALGERRRLSVTLRNAGPLVWGPTEESGLRLANRWLDQDGQPRVWKDGAAPIEERWLPGESRTFALWIEAPKKAGSWRLELDLVEEGAARFSSRGAAPMILDVEVSGMAAAAPDPAPSARNATPRLGRPETSGEERGGTLTDALVEARQALRRGNYETGAALLSRVRTELRPLFVALGEIELDRGELRKAEESLLVALNLAPNDAAGHFALGRLRESQGRRLAAYRAYRRSRTLAEDEDLRRFAEIAIERITPGRQRVRKMTRRLRKRARRMLGLAPSLGQSAEQ